MTLRAPVNLCSVVNGSSEGQRQSYEGFAADGFEQIGIAAV
ncbi:MAG: hypothetical protein AAB401_18440 [Acidobacteriota bacterium]